MSKNCFAAHCVVCLGERPRAPGPVPVSLIYGMLLHLQEEQSAYSFFSVEALVA